MKNEYLAPKRKCHLKLVSKRDSETQAVHRLDKSAVHSMFQIPTDFGLHGVDHRAPAANDSVFNA